MVIKYLKRALIDLNNIAEYIALDNPEAAKKVITGLKISIDLLLSTPNIGRSGRVNGTRELIKSHYIIPYRIVKYEIQILRVFDTSQKPPKQW